MFNGSISSRLAQMDLLNMTMVNDKGLAILMNVAMKSKDLWFQRLGIIVQNQCHS
jgi:hypothetical protein